MPCVHVHPKTRINVNVKLLLRKKVNRNGYMLKLWGTKEAAVKGFVQKL